MAIPKRPVRVDLGGIGLHELDHFFRRNRLALLNVAPDLVRDRIGVLEPEALLKQIVREHSPQKRDSAFTIDNECHERFLPITLRLK